MSEEKLNGVDRTLEAGFSATVKVINPESQFEWLVTTRADSAKDGLPRLSLIEKWLGEHGYVSMDAYIDQRRVERGQDQAPRQSKPAEVPHRADSGALTFRAKTMEATINGGKAYWKVKGGKFDKFGITIWPEVLEDAGFNLEELDPMKVYQLDAYVAAYTLKEDGKPDKIVKLNQA